MRRIIIALAALGYQLPEGVDPEPRLGHLHRRVDQRRHDGIVEPIPGTFTTGCLLPNVRGACD